MRPSLEFCREQFTQSPVYGAEIGVALGDNAAEMLTAWPELKLILVDNYWHSLEWAARTRARLSEFSDRITWYQTLSAEASREVPDNSLDFAYIDADHSYGSCSMDIRIWWLKVKQGGVLCGHDFFHEPGVNKAVCEFAQQHNLLLTAKWSDDWWLVKQRNGEIYD